LSQSVEDRRDGTVRVGTKGLARFTACQESCVLALGSQGPGESLETGRLAGLSWRMDDEVVAPLDETANLRKPPLGGSM